MLISISIRISIKLKWVCTDCSISSQVPHGSFQPLHSFLSVISHFNSEKSGSCYPLSIYLFTFGGFWMGNLCAVRDSFMGRRAVVAGRAVFLRPCSVRLFPVWPWPAPFSSSSLVRLFHVFVTKIVMSQSVILPGISRPSKWFFKTLPTLKFVPCAKKFHEYHLSALRAPCSIMSSLPRPCASPLQTPCLVNP